MERKTDSDRKGLSGSDDVVMGMEEATRKEVRRKVGLRKGKTNGNKGLGKEGEEKLGEEAKVRINEEEEEMDAIGKGTRGKKGG